MIPSNVYKRLRKRIEIMPKAIRTDWQAIRLLVCAGTTYREAAEQFQITEAVIRKRASREKWPTPRAVREKAKELMAIKRSKGQDDQHQPIVPMSQRVTNELVTAKMAENWLEKGESHRVLAFEMANSSLQKAAKGTSVRQSRGDCGRRDAVAQKPDPLSKAYTCESTLPRHPGIPATAFARSK